MYVLHAEEMNKLDEYAISRIGIPQCVLMERAALGVADCITQCLMNESVDKDKLSNSAKTDVLILSGPGNCGGDGMALARILLDRDFCVQVYLPLPLEKCKESVRKEAECYKEFGGTILYELPDKEYDFYVDAMFGIGLNRPLSGNFEQAVNRLNSRKNPKKSRVISIDIPSGIHTDTGTVLGTAVKADYTVTFSYLKPGLLLDPGYQFAGKVILSSIGIDTLKCFDRDSAGFTFRKEEVKLKDRNPSGNKGSFHRVLVIAGGKSMCGAAILASVSAFRSGAGYVEVLTHEQNRNPILSALPEAILHTYSEKPDEFTVKDLLSKADSVVIGPGLAEDASGNFLVETVLKHCEKPLVIDAGAINLISEKEEYKELLKNRAGKFITVLTPHPGELSRLTRLPVKSILEHYEKTVLEVANEYGVILVGKGATTLVTNGQRIYYNRSGNDGMATAGSGDVLSGMAGTFLVNENDPFIGICLAVYCHGLAGEKASDLWGKRSVLASDLWKGILEE